MVYRGRTTWWKFILYSTTRRWWKRSKRKKKLKILTSKKLITTLQILLAQIKARINSFKLTLLRLGFSGLLADGSGQKIPVSLKSVTHILQWWKLAQSYLTQRRRSKEGPKNIWNTWNIPWVLLTSVFFTENH